MSDQCEVCGARDDSVSDIHFYGHVVCGSCGDVVSDLVDDLLANPDKVAEVRRRSRLQRECDGLPPVQVPALDEHAGEASAS